MSVWVVEYSTDLDEWGCWTVDGRAYRTREDAEKRAMRLRLDWDDSGIGFYARVTEMRACWDAGREMEGR